MQDEKGNEVNMTALRFSFLILGLLALTASCSTISKDLRSEAEPSLPYKTMVNDIEKYVGKTVILGGYIEDTKNLDQETIVTVVQAPLSRWQIPKSKAESEGRFVVLHEGYLEWGAYEKGRKVSVAGTVVGLAEGYDSCPPPCLEMRSREFRLQPKPESQPPFGTPNVPREEDAGPSGFQFRDPWYDSTETGL
jgi:outer membrane lipoprotein